MNGPNSNKPPRMRDFVLAGLASATVPVTIGTAIGYACERHFNACIGAQFTKLSTARRFRRQGDKKFNRAQFLEAKKLFIKKNRIFNPVLVIVPVAIAVTDGLINTYRSYKQGIREWEGAQKRLNLEARMSRVEISQEEMQVQMNQLLEITGDIKKDLQELNRKPEPHWLCRTCGIWCD